MLKQVSIYILLSLFTLVASQAADKPEVNADEIVSKDGKLVASGDAELSTQDYNLRADKITYERDATQAEATGDVRVHHQSARLVTQQLNYNINDKEIEAGAFRVGEHPFYATGESVSGQSEELVVKDGILYFHQPHPYSPNIKAGTITFLPPDKAIVEDATLRIGEFPIWYMSKQTIERKESPIRLRSKLGIQSNLGGYSQNTLLVPVFTETQNVKAGVLLDAYTKRGILFGPAADYDYTSADTHARGTLRVGYIDDHGDKGTDILGNPIEEERYFINLKHKQDIGEKAQLTARLGWWSDSEVERDFRENLYREHEQPDNFLEAMYYGENYYLSAFARFRPNEFIHTQERLPEVRFDLPSIPIGKTLYYQEFQASVAMLEDKDPSQTVRTYDSERAHAYYGIRRPHYFKPWLTLTPVVGTSITHYEKTLNRSDSYTRLLGQIGLDLDITAHRTWEYKNDTWEIDGIRHIVHPLVQYRYIPEADAGRSRIPPIERDINSTLLDPIDLANTRNLDDKTETHTMRFGLENLLQTRDPENPALSRELASANIYQDLNFSTRNADDQEWSSTYTELEINPAPWIAFSLYNRLNPETLTQEEMRTRTTLTNGDQWKLHFTTDNLDSQTDQYYLDLEYRLSERHYLIPHWRYDSHRGKLVEQQYAMRSYIGHTWRLDYGISFYNGNSRDNETRFNLAIDLVDGW